MLQYSIQLLYAFALRLSVPLLVSSDHDQLPTEARDLYSLSLVQAGKHTVMTAPGLQNTAS
jgi:hypothetical protein